ncbi:MAG: Xylose isomerase-like TIM barrel [Syntrophus sp. PtaB.Bin001]|nr:MAG: Xylose isomerase-like TIM barrel [Syntrophus sp. PtaB.Bin001]
MKDILRYIQVHVPFRMLEGNFLKTIVREGINPEIGFDYTILDTAEKGRFKEVAARLSDAGLRVTFHAPFMDLRPGAIDPLIREASRQRLMQIFELVPLFHPLTVVCHPCFDSRYYVSTEAQWLENSLHIWKNIADLAAQLSTLLVLENVYENTPRQLSELLKLIDSENARFCFDTGHYNAFADTPLEFWLAALGDFLGEVHLHDNNGSKDEHLPIGEGNFPFERLFAFFRERSLKPIMTLEAHSEAHFRRTVETLSKNRLFGTL